MHNSPHEPREGEPSADGPGQAETIGILPPGMAATAVGPVPVVATGSRQPASTASSLRTVAGELAPGRIEATGIGGDGPERLGRYENLGEIARGGMGQVFRVRDLDLHRALVLKVMLCRSPAPDVEHRFVEEAQISGQLQHPGIPPIYELGFLADGRPYYTMKFIQGHTLAEILAVRPDPAHDLPRFVAVFESICQTMAYAHARGVVHRDLKPLNVMVGSFGEVQVMDWGLAKILGRAGAEADLPGSVATILTVRSETVEGASLAGSVKGTPAYMPPEQALGQTDRVDERADVFALGSILCEILTGRPAYVGGSVYDLLDKARVADLADALARLHACGADPELIELARVSLAPAPEARPRDAGALAARVSAHLASVQGRLRAAEVARVEATAKAEHERKRRRLAVSLAASVVALIGLGTGGWIHLDRLRAARRAEAVDLVNQALRDAESWLAKARSAPSGDSAAWADAVASAREARDALRGGEVGADLRRRVDATLATIAKERDDAQAEIPGCLASRKGLRLAGITRPPAIEIRRPESAWPSPDYSGFTILRVSNYVDLSNWKPIPPGTTPDSAGRVEPALITRVVDLIRKVNVSKDNTHVVYQYRGEGFEIDLHCPGRRYVVRGSASREQLGGSTRPVLIREIEVDLSDVPVGEEVRVVTHVTSWNGFQVNSDGKQWAGLLATDNLSEGELAVKFPRGLKPASSPSLFVFLKGSPKKALPPLGQNFHNPLDQEWWVWRPRDILKDFVYQIEWDWSPAHPGSRTAGPVGKPSQRNP